MCNFESEACQNTWLAWHFSEPSSQDKSTRSASASFLPNQIMPLTEVQEETLLYFLQKIFMNPRIKMNDLKYQNPSSLEKLKGA